MPSYERTVDTIDGCNLSVLQGGDGPPLLFLHGAAGAGHWLPFMDELAKRYTVIVPEHPGFGSSGTPNWLRDIGDLAYFYLDYLASRSLKDVHLVGNSLGGWIACEMAVRSCERLRSLTLVSPAGIQVPGLPPRGDTFLWSPEQAARNLYHDQSFAEAALAAPVDDAEIDRRARNALTTALLAWEPRFFNPQLAKWLHRIEIPTLVLWGEEDRVFPAAYGTEFANRIPGARLVTFDGCGHLPHVERAKRFVSTVVEFAEEARR